MARRLKTSRNTHSGDFGWIRPFLVGILTGIVVVGLLVYVLSFRTVSRNEFSLYKDPVGIFSFQYTTQFFIEADADVSLTKKYGDDYIVGFRHAFDPRIGCEVRKSTAVFSIDLSAQNISQQLVAQYSKNTQGFSLVQSGKISLQKNVQAFEFRFTFIDPLLATMLIHQVFIPHGKDMYLLTCGVGRAYSEKFESDFDVFFSSFAFYR